MALADAVRVEAAISAIGVPGGQLLAAQATGDDCQRLGDQLVERLDFVLDTRFAAALEQDPEFVAQQDRLFRIREYVLETQEDALQQV